MTPKTDTEGAASIAEAARVTGISRTSLTAYKRDGCQAFKSNGRVNLAELDAWAEVHGKKSARDTDAIKAERLRILRATALRLERENLLADGMFVEKAAVKRGLAQAAAELFDTMEQVFLNEMPPILKGCDEMMIATELRRAINTFRERLKARYAALAAEKP